MTRLEGTNIVEEECPLCISREHDEEVRTIKSQRDELLKALEGLTDDIQGLIDESSGIYGLHLNGDPSPWDEVEAGGRFERLTHLPIAYKAIASVKGGAA